MSLVSGCLSILWEWPEANNNQYSTKEGYRRLAIVERSRIDSLGQRNGLSDLAARRDVNWVYLVWNKLTNLKVKLYTWKVLLDWNPSLSNLQRRNVICHGIPICCKMCGTDDETSGHVLFGSVTAKQVWNGVCKWLDRPSILSADPFEHLDDFWKQNRGIAKDRSVAIGQGVVWQIWRARNG